MDTRLENIRNERNPLEKKIRFLSWLNSELEEKFSKRTILVGGTAVELYSGAAFQSVDIDVIYGASSDIDQVLLKVGFRRSGRYWLNDDLDIQLEAPSASLDGELSMVTCVTIDGGKVYVIGVEDLILDRLKAWCYWNDRTSLEQAAFLMRLNEKAIDFPYLRKKADIDAKMKGAILKESSILPWLQAQ